MKWLGTNQEPQMIEQWITFQDLQPFSHKHEPKTSRGAPDVHISVEDTVECSMQSYW